MGGPTLKTKRASQVGSHHSKVTRRKPRRNQNRIIDYRLRKQETELSAEFICTLKKRRNT